ncbi:nucleotidyltransferase [Arthrobacter crystallopoietes BAB-32]|uniref:Nucleotidyltransferase n=1 Tax=Arthrobacter crystallopoietes BAB-32 TaxID=1246476 RepID=N1V6M2_9MICC|nr:nucleotidyltransferase domain-containing protein [Arthrobacter crystallopoietes]EMY33888.1 nucleotidyltransferase [Arthrobacter crystallopoietes BAB-32]
MRLLPALSDGKRGELLAVLDFLMQRRRLVAHLAAINHIQSVAVFGSVARREEKLDSDVDFLVNPDDEASLFHLAQFAEDMEGLLGRPADVVSRRGLDPELDRAILTEAVAL